jgi:hypothetical protein
MAVREEDRPPTRERPLGVWLIGLLALAALVPVGAGVYLDPAAARAALREMSVIEVSVELVGVLVFLVATVQLLRLQRSAVAWFGAAFFLYPLGTLTAWAIDGPPSALPSLLGELFGWALRLGFFGYAHRLTRLGILG